MATGFSYLKPHTYDVTEEHYYQIGLHRITHQIHNHNARFMHRVVCNGVEGGWCSYSTIASVKADGRTICAVMDSWLTVFPRIFMVVPPLPRLDDEADAR